MGIKYKNIIINQYHVIKVRLNGPNISCTTPNDIPNAPKLKVVIIVFRSTLVNFESYVFLLYRPITIYNDRYTINTPIQINSQSASKNLFKIFSIKLPHLPISNSVYCFQVFVHNSSTVCGNFPTKQRCVPQSNVLVTRQICEVQSV